jgi:hypothetical protein
MSSQDLVFPRGWVIREEFVNELLEEAAVLGVQIF